MGKYLDSGGLSHFMGLVKDNVDDAYAKILSRGEQLVVNGNGMLGDNTNFPLLTFDGSHSNGSPGSFTSPTRLYKTIPQAELMSADTSKEYTAEFDVMSDGEGSAAKMYGCLYFYDADKNNISIVMVSFIPGSTTTLARELKSGDTVVYLEDASGFKSTTRADQRSFIFWDYTNSFGYTYPPETYSRNFYYKSTGHWENSAIDYSANTITLLSPYSGPTRPAGTSLSQGSSGGTYYYFWWNTGGTISVGEWMHASGIISGIGRISGTSPNPPAGKFWPGTAYVRIGFLWNYNSTASNLQKQLWVTNISFSEKRSAVDVVPIAEKAREIIPTTVSRVTNANTAAEATTALRHYLASSSMSSNKPMSDGHIIEMEWDTAAGYKAQLFVPNNITPNDPHIQWRPQNGNNWPAWITVFDTRSTIPAANGGTGQTSLNASANALLGSLTPVSSSDAADTTDFITSAVGGGTTTFYRRNASFVWNWIKSKISSILGLTSSQYGGNAATATTAGNVTGTVAIANGGTGATTAAAAWTALGGGAIGKKASLAASDIPAHASTATTYGAGSSTNYGHLKLSDSTASTSGTGGGTAATPSAVKAAYDKAAEAMSAATGGLYYDIGYTVSNGVVTGVPRVYSAGAEVTTDYAKECFSWFYKTGTGGSWVQVATNNDRSCTVAFANAGKFCSLKCDFTPA